MSYILDALRKSDQQRRRGEVPTLQAAPAAAVERPAFLFYGLVGMILIVVGMAIGWLRPWRPEPPASEPVAAKPLESPPPQPAPAPLLTMPAKVEPEPPRHEPPSAAVPTPAAPAPKQEGPAPARAETRGRPPVAVSAKHREVAAVTPEEHAGKGLSDAAAEQKLMTRSDLPAPIQQELPPMSVAMHVYSSQPRERLVSIDNRILREGDYLAPDLRLEQITPVGMIFSYRGYRFRRGVQ